MKREQLLKQFSAGSGDLILFAVGHPASVNKTLDRLRVYVANDLGLIDHVSLMQCCVCVYLAGRNFFCFAVSYPFLSSACSPSMRSCG